jgi:hypothetical protein
MAQMFAVHPTQVGGWKRQALAGLPDVFGNGREQIRQQVYVQTPPAGVFFVLIWV